ncbi:MAG TPA: SAM-dependent methyltransferase, partial [Phycisphaerales bacterium]|nr:SAM-dependent methyltransferase [Phycisphaerales bacterium]
RQEGLARSTEFLRLNRERVYDLVVGNPPYQNRSKMADSKFLEKNYKEGKADLYSAFLLRGLEFAKPGGLSTLLTLRGWMFLGTFSALREHLLADHELVALGDLDRGGFEDILDEVVSVAINCFRKGLSSSLTRSVALLPTPRDNKDRDNRRTYRKKAALLTQVGRYEFRAEDLKVVPDQPLVYWWNSEFLQIYSRFGKLSDIAETRVGLRTSDNARYLRRPWELESAATLLTRDDVTAEDWPKLQWCPYIKGAAGVKWFEPASYAVRWQDRALQICVALQYRYNAYPQSSEFYFQKGIAMAAIGAACIGRAHRYRSVFDVMGQSIFPSNMPKMLCLVNTSLAQDVLASLNPSVHFQVGDIDRLPLFPIALAEEIVAQLELSFTEHEQSREASVEFVQPGSSAWTYAQEWAQRAVDRPAGEPLPPV